MISDEEVQAIHEELMKMVKKNAHYTLYAHVDKIDGICIQINIGYFPSDSNRLHFIACIRGVYSIDDDDEVYECEDFFRSEDVPMKGAEGLAEEDVRFVLLEIYRLAAILKFDKRCGRFRKYSVKGKCTDFMTGEDCVVCLEKTKIVSTCCKCHLCVKCFQHLSPEEKCPICRELRMAVRFTLC